jgi:fucose permease
LTQTFTRNRATWLGYLILALYSYFLNVFGPITPFLKDELNLSYTVSSLHFSAFALGMIVIGLVGHQIIQRLGRWNALWISAFGMSLSALLLIAGRNPYVTISASFLMGVIGSMILSIVPAVLSEQHGERHAIALSEANVLGSVLGSVAPVLVGWFALSAFGWRAALVVATLAMILMRIGFGRVNLTNPQATEISTSVQSELPRLYWIYWAGIVTVVSIEFCMIFWSADYLEIGLGMLKADAAQAVSLFLGGMIIGRFSASRLVQRFTSHQILIGSLSLVAIGFLIYWLAAVPLVGMIGLFLTGLGVSSLYPLLLSLAIGSAKNSLIRASAFASLASGVAIFTLPLILGRVADAVGIHSAYAIILVLLVVAFGIVLSTWRVSAVKPAAETTSS